MPCVRTTEQVCSSLYKIHNLVLYLEFFFYLWIRKYARSVRDFLLPVHIVDSETFVMEPDKAALEALLFARILNIL